MTKQDYISVKKYAKTLGLSVKSIYYNYHCNLDIQQASCVGKKITLYIKKRKWKNNYINWTDVVFDLCHEIGHFLYDLNNPAPIMSDKAYSYLPANNGGNRVYIPKQYRKYILQEEMGATDFIPIILKRVNVKYSQFCMEMYFFEIAFMYMHSNSHNGKDATYQQTYNARREFRRLRREAK